MRAHTAFGGTGIVAEEASAGHEAIDDGGGRLGAVALGVARPADVHHNPIAEQHVPPFKESGADELAIADGVVLDGDLAGALTTGWHLAFVVLIYLERTFFTSISRAPPLSCVIDCIIA